MEPARSDAAAQVQTAAESGLQRVSRSDDDLLILELRLRSFVLGDAIEGYLEGGGLLLPLGDFTRALDFPISIEPESGHAEGWFLDENRLFALDLQRREVIVMGRRMALDMELVEFHERDIYVDTRLLSRWFPVDVEFDLSNLTVEMTSREPLPIEQAMERERRRAKLLRSTDGRRAGYPKLDLPYKLLDWPFMDTSVETTFRRSETGGKALASRYNTLITGDALFMNAKLFLSGGDRDPLSKARLELSRKDPERQLLGPLQVSEIALGDVAGPQIALTSRSNFGRGFVVSSFPLNQRTEFDRITLRGELPLGWEAELYRNEVLLNFTGARDDGRYEFTDVPLIFGLNILRVELFGPQGQRREEGRRILVGPGLVRPGEVNFRIAAGQQDKDLFPIRDDTVKDENKLEGSGRFFAQLEGGITRNVSLAGGVTSLPFEDQRRHYGNLSLRAVLGSVYSRFDVVPDSTGGWAATAALQTRLATNLSVSVEHGVYNKFVSEQVQDGSDFLKTRSKVRLDGVLAPPVLPRIPVSITGDLDRMESGRMEAQISNRISVPIRRVSLSNNFAARINRGGGNNTTTLSGDFLIGGRFNRLNIRGQVGYDLVPLKQVATTSVTGEWYVDTDFTARLGVVRRLSPTRQTTFSAGLSRRFRYLSVGLNGDYVKDGSFGVRLTTSFGLGREPRKGRLRLGARAVADKGAVSARVFLDRNTNGRFDAEDEPLEGVRFKANQGPTSEPTNQEGIAILSGLPPHQTTDLELDKASLEDPYWVPSPEGVTLVPRPGVVALAEFPVIATAEIDGTVFQRVGDANREVSNVVVQLLNPDGDAVKEVKSAFDGFYLFDFVSPGRYLLRIDPEQMSRLKMSAPEGREIELTGEDVLNGEDFVITRLSEAPPLVSEAPQATEPEAPAKPAEPPQTDEPPRASPQPAPPAPPASAGTESSPGRAVRYWVQLGAYRDPALAYLTWRRLKRDHARLLQNVERTVPRADLGRERGVFYQLRAGGFATRAGAVALCASLKARSVDCFAIAARDGTAGTGDDDAAFRRTRPEPAFESLRVRRGGQAVIAGSAPANWYVAIFADRRAMGWFRADASGKWTWTPAQRFAAGTHRLRALAFAPNGRVLVSRSDLVLVMPGAATGAGPGQAPLALSVLRDGFGESKVLVGVAESGDLSVGMIEYDTGGRIAIIGRAPPEAALRVYLGEELAGRATADADGRWRLGLTRQIPAGPTRIRVEHVSEENLVVERFTVVQDFGVSMAPALAPHRITVERGHNLWRIARSVYGRGTLYTVIYGANRDRIDDPDHIRPGQLLLAPKLD